MIKDTLVALSGDVVMRMQRYTPTGKAYVTLMQPESTDEGNLFVSRSIAVVIDAQKANEIATQFLMLAKEMEAKS